MLTDAEFIQLKQIRKKNAARMKTITIALKKAANEAMQLDQEMRNQAARIINHESPTASFTPNFTPNFKNVVTLADTVLSIVNNDEEDEIVVVSKPDQAFYAKKKYGIENFGLLPPNWNPSTHYHCDDFRPLTPSFSEQQQDPIVVVADEYETPEGSWLVKEYDEEYLSETKETVVCIPKEEHATFARKKYGIKDLSIIPPEWTPTSHYCSGDFRPKTPSFGPLQVLDDSTYDAPDGCWLVPL
jgi:hypothetical protein